MPEKVYDIMLDSAGWSCRFPGGSLGTFPSWLLAVGAARAAAERDLSNGVTPVVRYQDLKGAMHVLDLDSNDAKPPQLRPAHARDTGRLAGGQRPY